MLAMVTSHSGNSWEVQRRYNLTNPQALQLPHKLLLRATFHESADLRERHLREERQNTRRQQTTDITHYKNKGRKKIKPDKDVSPRIEMPVKKNGDKLNCTKSLAKPA